ncbi:MAG: transglycosylase SLT domain-containing protein [Deferribacteraceae bacterium]|nr:transglycosylase SLT domain-containing protein [Deferribacteraceae bacterium]
MKQIATNSILQSCLIYVRRSEIKKLLFISVLLLIALPIYAGEKAEYAKVLSDYILFEKLVRKETENVRSLVQNVWGDELLTSNRRWVEYFDNSQGLNIRGSYQFYSGELKLEVILDDAVADPLNPIPDEITAAALRGYMRRLLLLDFKQVYEDSPHGTVERAMQDRGIDMITADLQSNILYHTITGTDSTFTEMEDFVDNVFRSASYSLKESENGKIVLNMVAHFKPQGAEHERTMYEEIIAGRAANAKGVGDIVRAIAHVESGFNPTARSGASAYGLMQVVPSSAGLEISKVLYGKPVVLSPSYLFDADRNVEAGIIYLSILYNKYFSEINDPVSRIYCVIAAYNGGASTVARAFVGSRNVAKAIEKINKMTSEEVCNRLITKLPYKETRQYLERVLAAMN